jgi:hemerythrin-like domain-containing protein
MATSVPLMQISQPGQSTPAAGFEQPFEMLGACHERVERMLRLIIRLQEHLQTQGLDDQVRQAARDVMRYFDLAAPLHHEDEERHVFPPLMCSADPVVMALVLRLSQDHRQMEVAWQGARSVLLALAEHGATPFVELTVWQKVALNDFARLYRQHLDDEDKVIYPVAKVQMSAEALATMGTDMMARRGVTGHGPQR